MNAPKSINEALIDRFIAQEVCLLKSRYNRADLLDIGSGDLRYSKYFVVPNWNAIYSDYEKRAQGVDVLLDAHCLPFGDNSFDIITMTEVLEHLHHPGRALSEITRVLRPGGRLLITFPFMWGLHELPNDYFRFTEFGFSALCKDAGLTIEKFWRRGNSFALLISLIDMMISGLFHYLGKIRGLSFVSRVLSRGSSIVFSALYIGYVRCVARWGDQHNFCLGGNLDSPMGKLRLWHLGYNVVCIKNWFNEVGRSDGIH